MKEIGKIIKQMERVNTSGKLEIDMKETGLSF